MCMFDQLNEFHELERIYGRYGAIMHISNMARKIALQFPNCVSESDCITYVLTGKKPKSIQRYENKLKNSDKLRRLDIQYVNSITEEFLSQVIDEGIKDSVRASIKASKEAKHLVFIYLNIDSNMDHTRVRILTRMIWYSL